MVRRRNVGWGRLGAGLMASASLALTLAAPTVAQLTTTPSQPLPTAPGASTTTAPAPGTPATTAPPTSATTAPSPVTTAPPPAITEPPGSTATTVAQPTLSTSAPADPSTSSSSTTSTTSKGPPPASLSESSVRSFLDSASRSGTNNSTTALLDALRPLYDMGMTAEEIVAKGFGRFPVGGQAYFRDDFMEYRMGPPEHGHQGTDIFAPFNAPVRAPAAGIVTFAEEGLGGKAAYVTEADGTWYYMAHLNGFPADLRHGSPVSVGQIVGFNGDSGNAKGGVPHVHFEVHPRGGAAVNPKPLLDQWLLDALAAVPQLVVPLREVLVQNTRPMSALSVTRAFDRRMRAEPNPMDSLSTDDDLLAAAFVSPLTPPALRRDDARPVPAL